MATRDQISQAIESYLTTNWATTPIQFENVEAKDPVNPTKLLSEGTSPYIYCAIAYSDSNAAEVGGALKRTSAVIHIEVRVRDGKGTRLAQSYISSFQQLLEYTNISDAKIRGSSSRDGFSSGGWYILPVAFKFRYDR